MMIEGSILTRKRKFRGSHVLKMIERSSYQIPVIIDKYSVQYNEEEYLENVKLQEVKHILGIAATRKATISSDNEDDAINGNIVVYSTEYLHDFEIPNSTIYFQIETVPGKKQNKYKLLKVQNWGCYYIYHAQLAY